METIGGSTAKDRVLQALIGAGAEGMTTAELNGPGGLRAAARVHELQRAGWPIDKLSEGKSVYRWRLMDGDKLSMETVPVADLVGEQVRFSLKPDRIAQYAEDMQRGDEFPPIDVFRDEQGRLWLADGFHRKHAAVKAGIEDLPARVYAGSESDALWFALGANRKHGAGMTDHDKKHAVELALVRWPEKSTRLIAEQVGCADTYVSRIKREQDEVRTSAHLPTSEDAPPATVVGKDGKRYPARHDKSRKAIAERVTKISELAESGASTVQIAAAVGVGEDRVRAVCKASGIAVPADAVMRKTRRIDSNNVIEKTVEAAAMLTEETRFIDWKEVDSTRVPEWVTSLRKAKKAITRFIHRLEEARQ